MALWRRRFAGPLRSDAAHPPTRPSTAAGMVMTSTARGRRQLAAVPPTPIVDKNAELQARVAQQVALGATVDKMMCRADGESQGCFGALLAALRRRRPAGGAASPFSSSADASLSSVAGAGAATATAPPSAWNGAVGSRALFGLAGRARASPTSKLQDAADAMRVRVEQLEARVAEQRGEAKRLMQAGQKQLAMRALRRANAVQKQVCSNQSAVDAVEQQLDALSQAAMQKTLANALASTSKTMKRDAKALGKAEAAIDDAQEARDMATDLANVVAEFAQTGQGAEDDDELMAELRVMMMSEADDGAPPPPVAVEAAAATLGAGVGDDVRDAAAGQRAAARRLQQAHDEWDAAEAVRQQLPHPPRLGAGTGTLQQRAVERTGLLAQES